MLKKPLSNFGAVEVLERVMTNSVTEGWKSWGGRDANKGHKNCNGRNSSKKGWGTEAPVFSL